MVAEGQTHAVSPALTNALAAERTRFNAQVAEMRRRDPRFDVAALAAFIRTGLDAVARAVDGVAPQQTIAATRSAFDIALTLVAQGLVGPAARNPFVERAWCAVAPACARLLAGHAREVLAMLSNAATSVASIQGAHPQRWIDELRLTAPLAADAAQLRVLGQVAAWRAGLAQYRRSAVQAAARLPAELALVATGRTGRAQGTSADAAHDWAYDWAHAQQALLGDPWWAHADDRLPVHRNGIEVGAFTGFGGAFAQPPQVRVAAAGFVVRSADRVYLLVADAHGAVLLPAHADEWQQAAGNETSGRRPNAAYLEGARLIIGERIVVLDGPDRGLAIVQDEHTVVIASPYSHALRLVATR